MSAVEYLTSIRAQLEWLDQELAQPCDEDFRHAALGLLKHISNRLDALKLSQPQKIDG
jgi:hypothetical protein